MRILQTELQNETNFNLFTKVLKRKIEGGMLSEEYLENGEKAIILEVGFIEYKIIFDCPYCRRTCQINSNMQEYECDCGNIINLKNTRTESRYVLLKKAYSDIQHIFSQTMNHDDLSFQYIFGEKAVNILKHDSNIYLHISPFIEQNNKFQSIDNAYIDHFSVDWKIFPDIINDANNAMLLNDILHWRKEAIFKQINWLKINEWDFQNLTVDLLEPENIFSSIIPGGKGPDQGKDGIGYRTIEFLKGKPKESKTLIQCKYTKKNKQSFTKRAIESSITDAKSLNCNSLLFVTNGYLSGDAVTKIESGAYEEKDFFGVDFWDNHRLFSLLEKYPIIRIKYFYNK